MECTNTVFRGKFIAANVYVMLRKKISKNKKSSRLERKTILFAYDVCHIKKILKNSLKNY